MASNDQYILQSVDNTLSIVELLCHHEEMSLAEIVSATEFGKSTVYRMLATLERHKLLTKTKNNAYRLGYRFASIGAIVTARSELTEVVHSYLQELSTQTNETTHLAVFVDDTKVQFIDKVRGTSSIWMESTVGMTREAHMTGTGKAILAFQNDELIERYIQKIEFKRRTDNTITDGQKLMDELEKIRRNGYACDNEESEAGLICYAAPISNFKGEVIAAISISGFKEKMNFKKELFINAVVNTAKQISDSLL